MVSAGVLVNHPSWNEQTHWVFKKTSLKLNVASYNNASWYTDTDGFFKHKPRGGSLYYEGPTLQKIVSGFYESPSWFLLYEWIYSTHLCDREWSIPRLTWVNSQTWISATESHWDPGKRREYITWGRGGEETRLALTCPLPSVPGCSGHGLRHSGEKSMTPALSKKPSCSSCIKAMDCLNHAKTPRKPELPSHHFLNWSAQNRTSEGEAALLAVRPLCSPRMITASLQPGTTGLSFSEWSIAMGQGFSCPTQWKPHTFIYEIHSPVLYMRSQKGSKVKLLLRAYSDRTRTQVQACPEARLALHGFTNISLVPIKLLGSLYLLAFS